MSLKKKVEDLIAMEQARGLIISSTIELIPLEESTLVYLGPSKESV